MKVFAVIPTGSRPTEYNNVIDWCNDHFVTPITIATTEHAAFYARGITILSNELNISKWWNLGIDEATEMGADYIAVLNDDVELPDTWLQTMLKGIYGHSGVSGERGQGKITGYAFLLDSKDGIRADERLVWWWSDDIIQYNCNKSRGFKIIPGYDVPNIYANSSVNKMSKQIEKDKITFHKITSGVL